LKLSEKIGDSPLIRTFLLIILEPSFKASMVIFNKLWGVDNNSVVFSSFGGRSYSDNPRAISEKLHEKDPSVKIFWLFQNIEEKRAIVPSYVSLVKKGTLKSLKIQATAKFWVDNFKKPPYFYKNSNQIYIQTWHGDRGFKKVLFDNEHYKFKLNLLETENLDLAITGSKFGENQFRSAMLYNGEILKEGCPRNDILLANNDKEIEKIKKSLNIDLQTKILLFAPTFRIAAELENRPQEVFDLDITALLKILTAKTDSNWTAFIRGHYFVKSLEGIEIDNKKIFDGNAFEDMKELLLISDFLITDYSSCAGDFALLNRPIILYQPDKKEYIKNDRSLYFNIEDSPFMVATNQQDLVSKIEKLDFTEAEDNCKNILKFYGTYETGNASERVANFIVKKAKAMKLN